MKGFIVAIGLGTLRIVLGLTIGLNVVNLESTAVDTATLGWILLAAGVLAIVVSRVATPQRGHTSVVEESRHRS